MTPAHALWWRLLLGGMLVLAGIGPARAAVQVQARVLSVPGIVLNDVVVDLLPDAAGGVHLRLSAQRASIDAVGWRRVAVDMDGTLTRHARQLWQFDGTVRLKHAPGGLLSDGSLRLVMDIQTDNLQVTLRQGKAQAVAALPLDQLTHAQIELTRVPLTWLQGLLAQAWSGRLTGGRVDASVALDVLPAGIRASTQFALSGAGFDSPDGKLAAQGLAARGRARLDTTAQPAQLGTDLALHGGQVLLGPLYAQLPEHDVRLALTARGHGGGMDLHDLQFADPDALELSGSIGLDADGGVRTLDFSRFDADLAKAYARYGKAWLATLGFADVAMSGHLAGNLTLGPQGLRAFAFDARNVDFDDSARGLAVSGLQGGLDWRANATRPATTLAWQSLRVYAIRNGAATSHWQNRRGVLGLTDTVRVPVFGGQVVVSSLDWSPAAASGKRLQTSLAVTGVDMRQLSRAFGWPAFEGTLAGAMPGLNYSGDRFQLDGGLSLNVFGGFINVTRMSLQQPFGPTPVLAADVAMQQLDLAAITQVFDFGSITGRLHGAVDDLRLVDWSPAAFKATLLADAGGRISQRAVNNLTSVGGGGIAGGLQGAVLKLFKSFGYDRIGLSCTLTGKVCHMSGLEPVDGGFLIVDGRGLPHLKVVGHEHTVSWPTLVERLGDAISGTGPVIE